MLSAERRLQSVVRHLAELEIRFTHGIDSLRPLEQSPESSSYPMIIGGMVLDIVARPDSHPNPGTTTPGKVEYLGGGVARNVAECMSKLGVKPFMISVVGFDMAGDLLLKLWETAELPTEGILKLKNISTPVVANIFDRKGELFAGVARVDAVERFLSPDWISKFRNRIYSAPIVMVDANLHPDSLEAACKIASETGTPVWFEPVSVIKSARIRPIINYITCASPNEKELIAMANSLSSPNHFPSIHPDLAGKPHLSIQSLFDLLKPAINLLLKKGIKLLVVTLGSDGVFLFFAAATAFAKSRTRNENEVCRNQKLYKLVNEYCPSRQYRCGSSADCYAFHFPALDASVMSLTGAGDCLVGGVISSLCSGLDILQSVAVGIAAAKAAVEASENVPGEISLMRIVMEAQKVLSAGKQLVFG